MIDYSRLALVTRHHRLWFIRVFALGCVLRMSQKCTYSANWQRQQFLRDSCEVDALAERVKVLWRSSFARFFLAKIEKIWENDCSWLRIAETFELDFSWPLMRVAVARMLLLSSSRGIWEVRWFSNEVQDAGRSQECWDGRRRRAIKSLFCFARRRAANSMRLSWGRHFCGVVFPLIDEATLFIYVISRTEQGHSSFRLQGELRFPSALANSSFTVNERWWSYESVPRADESRDVRLEREGNGNFQPGLDYFVRWTVKPSLLVNSCSSLFQLLRPFVGGHFPFCHFRNVHRRWNRSYQYVGTKFNEDLLFILRGMRLALNRVNKYVQGIV